MTKEEALKMCLEYIETNAHERRHVRWAIKVALAEPTSGDYALGYGEGFNDACKRQPERPWVGLTVDELIDLERKHLSHENLTKAIEAKLKAVNGFHSTEKNT